MDNEHRLKRKKRKEDGLSHNDGPSSSKRRIDGPGDPIGSAREATSRASSSKPATWRCGVCQERMPIADFPKNPWINIRECKHVEVFCIGCIRGWMSAGISKKDTEITCPHAGCTQKYSYDDIKRYAAPEDFSRYDSALNLKALRQMPDFFACPNGNCAGGQLHEDRLAAPIFTCSECRYKYCMSCNSPWHADQTCKEYQKQMAEDKKQRRKEEKQSLDLIKQTTKKCPGSNCDFNVEKNGGCDHMTCSKCRFEFCWLCRADYSMIRKRGNHHHKRSCAHYSKSREARPAQPVLPVQPVQPAEGGQTLAGNGSVPPTT